MLLRLMLLNIKLYDLDLNRDKSKLYIAILNTVNSRFIDNRTENCKKIRT